jgi:dienelactone hydrolase
MKKSGRQIRAQNGFTANYLCYSAARMKTSFSFRVLILFACIANFIAPPRLRADAANSWTAPGQYEVQTVKYDWTDTNRDRIVPVKIYYPDHADGKFPVIIFSHGLGGSRSGYEYLGRYWASHGYISVHLQHLGSDSSVFQGSRPGEIMRSLKRSVANPQNSINRPLDVKFAIDQLEQIDRAESPLRGHLDLDRIGMAGHSFGAFTTMAIAGQVFVLPNGENYSSPDPRVKAAIAMSSSVPPKENQYDLAYSKIKIPIFHMTGTLDDSPVGETKAYQRRIPFDHTRGADAYLVTFTGGDHMIFSGRMLKMRGPKDAEFQKLICAGSTAFWDAYLKDNGAAKTWLDGGGFAADLGDEGVFEKKLAHARHP